MKNTRNLKIFILFVTLTLLFSGTLFVVASLDAGKRHITLGESAGTFDYETDGSDDQVQFQSAADWVAGKGGQIDIYPGVYYFDDTWYPQEDVVYNFMNVKIIVVGEAFSYLIKIRGDSNITFTGSLQIVGDGLISYGIYLGMNAAGTSRTTDCDLTMNRLAMEGITQTAIYMVNVSRVTVENVYLQGVPNPSWNHLNRGLWITGISDHITVNELTENCTGNAGFSLEGGGGGAAPIIDVTYVDYYNCKYLGDNDTRGLGMNLRYYRYFTITNCRTEWNHGHNTTTGYWTDGLTMINCRDGVVTGHISKNNTSSGYALGCTSGMIRDVTFIGCHAIENGGAGFALEGSPSETDVHRRIIFSGCIARTNGWNSGSDPDYWWCRSGFLIRSCGKVQIINSISGDTSDRDIQYYGVYINGDGDIGYTADKTILMGCNIFGNFKEDIHDSGTRSCIAHNINSTHVLP